MIQIVTADGVQEKAMIADLRCPLRRRGGRDHPLRRRQSWRMCVGAAIEAVEEYSLKFDKAAPREFAKEELDAAYAACDARLIRAMEHAAG